MRDRRISTPAAGPASSAAARLTAALAVAAALAVLSAAPVARAGDDGLTLSDAWIRMIVPARPAAGYFTLRNDGDRALVGADSPACGKLMLHESRTVDGVGKMVMVERVEVPAHGTLSFAPHGYHLMCMSPGDQLRRGHTVPVTLRFDGAPPLTAAFEVRGATGQ